MANTIDIMLSGVLDEDFMTEINDIYALDLHLVSNPELCGGSKTVWFESYAQCDRCSGNITASVMGLIEDMLKGAFPNKMFCLIVDCDDYSISSTIAVNKQK